MIFKFMVYSCRLILRLAGHALRLWGIVIVGALGLGEAILLTKVILLSLNCVLTCVTSILAHFVTIGAEDWNWVTSWPWCHRCASVVLTRGASCIASLWRPLAKFWLQLASIVKAVGISTRFHLLARAILPSANFFLCVQIFALIHSFIARTFFHQGLAFLRRIEKIALILPTFTPIRIGLQLPACSYTAVYYTFFGLINTNPIFTLYAFIFATIFRAIFEVHAFTFISSATAQRFIASVMSCLNKIRADFIPAEVRAFIPDAESPAGY